MKNIPKKTSRCQPDEKIFHTKTKGQKHLSNNKQGHKPWANPREARRHAYPGVGSQGQLAGNLNSKTLSQLLRQPVGQRTEHPGKAT